MDTKESLQTSINSTEKRIAIIKRTISKIEREIEERKAKDFDCLYQRNDLWKFEALLEELEDAHRDMLSTLADLRSEPLQRVSS